MNVSENPKASIHKKSQSVDFLKKIGPTASSNKYNSPPPNSKSDNLINPNPLKTNKNNNFNSNIFNNNNNNNNNNIKNNSPKFNKTFFNFNFTNFSKKTKNNNMSSTNGSNFFTNSTFLHNNNHKKTSSNFHLNEFQRKFQLENPGVPYDKYRKSTREIMSEYKYEALGASAINVLEKRLFIEDENFEKIKKDIYKKPESKQTLIEPRSPEAKMKVSVNQEEYKSPEKAFGVIWKNKIIHESMVKNFYERQKTQYDDFLKKVSEVDKFANTTHKRLKVTNSLIGNKGSEGDAIVMSLSGITNLGSSNIINNTQSNWNYNADENGNCGTPQAGNSINFTATAFSPINKKIIKFFEIPIDNDYAELYSYYVYPNKIFPEGREQFTFSYNGSDGILLGGLVSNKSNILWKLDPKNLCWAKENCEFSQSILLRYGHTTILHQKRLYVFGGRTKMHNYSYIPDLEIYNLEDKNWSAPTLYTKSTLKLRRNHVAVLVGNQIFIHGGISEEEEYLNDSFCLSLSPLKWQSLPISDEANAPVLAFHTACLVLPSEIAINPKFSIMKYPELGVGRRVTTRIREKGIYVFGGKSGEDGSLKNDMWILKIGKKPLDWVKPETKGSPPCPRYSHSMNFYESGNIIIIHGGRNDYSSDSFALNDTFIFELSKFEWIQAKLYFNSPRTKVYHRCGHSAILYTNKLIIFGGMNNMNYIGSSLFLIDLDSHLKPKSTVLKEVNEIAKNEINFDLNVDFKNHNLKSNKKQKKKEEIAIHRPISILNSNPMLPPIK